MIVRKGRSTVQIERTQSAVSYAILVTFVLFVVFPFYWMIVTSFKGETQMRSVVSMFWPSPFVAENYEHLFKKTEFVSWFGNSIIVAVSSTFLATAVGTLGAYALARLKFLGRAFMASTVLITYLVPPSILFIPLYAQIRNLGMADSLTGLIAAYPSFTVPFVTWLLMGYFESIPVELEESAMIDGATRFGAFRRVILPLAAPGLLASALYAFTQAWNEFLYALVFITNVKLRTLPVGLSTFITGDVYGWGYLMAGAVLTTLPVIPSPLWGEGRVRGLPQRRLDQRLEHEARDRLHLAVARPPDVPQHHVRLDPVDQRQRLEQPLVGLRPQGGGQRPGGPVQHVPAVAAPVRLLLQEPHPLERLVLQRELQGRPHVRLEPLEQRERLVEQLAHPHEPVGGGGLEAPHRGEALRHHRAHELGAAREVAIGGGTRDAGPHRELRDRRDATAPDQRHRVAEQQAVGARLGAGRAGVGGRRGPHGSLL